MAGRGAEHLRTGYRPSQQNLDRLAIAWSRTRPYLRGVRGLPLRLDVETLKRGLSFTFTPRRSDIDLLGEIADGGDYGDLLPHTETMEAFDVTCLCLGLPRLIAIKCTAGRAKSLEAISSSSRRSWTNESRFETRARAQT